MVFAQDFSADVFNTGKNAAKSGALYVKGNKMRIDRADGSPEQSAPLVMVDMDSHMVTIMDVANHAYMKTEVGPEQSLSFFRSRDANNACAELQKMASMTDCKKSGTETVNGRQAIKYTGKSDDGKPVVMWVSPEVNFVVKWQTKSDETGELKNVKLGPQSDSLFDIPAGYHNAVKEAEPEKNDTKEQKSDTKEEPPPSTPQ
jgi:hypothetical protein